MSTLPRSVIPASQIEDDGYDWFKRHDAIAERVKQRKYQLVLLGASMFHYWEGDRPGFGEYGTEAWNETMTQYNVLNLGFGFDRTQNMLWRLEHGELDGQTPDLIILHGGNNLKQTSNYPGDTPEEAAKGLIAVLKKLRELCPDAELLYLTFRNEPLIAQMNEGVRTFIKTENNMTFFDCAADFYNSDNTLNTALFLGDKCHLNNDGYRVLIKALSPRFAKLQSK